MKSDSWVGAVMLRVSVILSICFRNVFIKRVLYVSVTVVCDQADSYLL